MVTATPNAFAETYKGKPVRIKTRKIRQDIASEINVRFVNNLNVPEMVEQIILRGGITDPITVVGHSDSTKPFYTERGLADDEFVTLRGNRRITAGLWMLDNPGKIPDIVLTVYSKQKDSEDEAEKAALVTLSVEDANSIAQEVLKSLESVDAYVFKGDPSEMQTIIHDHTSTKDLATSEVFRLFLRELRSGKDEMQIIMEHHELLLRHIKPTTHQAVLERLKGCDTFIERRDILRKELHNTCGMWRMSALLGLDEQMLFNLKKKDGILDKGAGERVLITLNSNSMPALSKGRTADLKESNFESIRSIMLNDVGDGLVIEGGGPHLNKAVRELYQAERGNGSNKPPKMLGKSKVEESRDLFQSDVVREAFEYVLGKQTAALAILDAESSRLDKVVRMVELNLGRVKDKKVHAFLESITLKLPLNTVEERFNEMNA